VKQQRINIYGYDDMFVGEVVCHSIQTIVRKYGALADKASESGEGCFLPVGQGVKLGKVVSLLVG
jgi:hypothetical protein